MLLFQVKGKDLAELVACGREKMASVPSGGSAIPVAGGDGGASAATSFDAAEPVKEEKKEIVEESDEVINFLFFFVYLTNSFIFTLLLNHN